MFGGLTVLDFNRLRSANGDAAVAPLIAASIFLDILNVFLLHAVAVRRRRPPLALRARAAPPG